MNNINTDFYKPIENTNNKNTSNLPLSTTTDFAQVLLAKIQMAMELNKHIDNSNSLTPSPFSFSPDFSMFDAMNKPLNTVNPVQQAFNAYGSNVSPTKGKSTSSNEEINTIVREAAQKYNVDEKLIHSIIKIESNYNPNAKSSAGAAGLMQLMPATAKELGVFDRYNMTQNIFGGTKYIGKMLAQHNGNVQLALAAYNAGPGNVKKHGGIPPFKETQNYVRKVMDQYLA